MLTIAQHLDLMRHGTGVADDSRVDMYQSFNRAGRMLTRRRKWWWRLVPGYSLAAVISSADITLPSDFDSLDTITLSSGYGPVETITPDEYTRLIAGITAGNVVSGTKVLLPVSTFNATTGAETKVLKLLSAATANGSPTFVLTYWRAWKNVTAADVAAVPAIPVDFENALILLARACALDLQDQAESHEMQRYLQEVADLERADTTRIPEFAPSRGGANDMRRIPFIGPLTFP